VGLHLHKDYAVEVWHVPIMASMFVPAWSVRRTTSEGAYGVRYLTMLCLDNWVWGI